MAAIKLILSKTYGKNIMEERINKPRVFLSHSKKNSEFIEKVDADLRKCQIDTWLDTIEIRHGKSWQDSIFQYGLPSCDAIIVYFTEQSTQSSVVKKEMDVGLLQNLQDSNVAFLPYVSDEKIRSELRPDIQALQTPEWNDSNYYFLLPRVVAEIWRSYLERTISFVVKNERLKRVEAELELEKYKSQPENVFSKSEDKEFEFILNTFNLTKSISATVYSNYHRETEKYEKSDAYNLTVHLSSIFALLYELFDVEYEGKVLSAKLYEKVLETVGLSPDYRNEGMYFDMEDAIRESVIRDDLLMCGLIEKFSYTTLIDGSEFLGYEFEFSKKYFRFRFWLAYHQKLPTRFLIEAVKIV